MKDPTREELQNRVDLAKELCVQSLRHILHDTGGSDAEQKHDATRALLMLGIARRNYRRYELGMAAHMNPVGPRPCGRH